jgi:hypothetical protein
MEAIPRKELEKLEELAATWSLDPAIQGMLEMAWMMGATHAFNEAVERVKSIRAVPPNTTVN